MAYILWDIEGFRQKKWLDGKLMEIFSSTKNQIRQSLSHLIRMTEIFGFLIGKGYPYFET